MTPEESLGPEPAAFAPTPQSGVYSAGSQDHHSVSNRAPHRSRVGFEVSRSQKIGNGFEDSSSRNPARSCGSIVQPFQFFFVLFRPLPFIGISGANVRGMSTPTPRNWAAPRLLCFSFSFWF